MPVNIPLTLGLIATAGIAMRWLASRIGIPVVAAYLLTGALLGPLGIGVIGAADLAGLLPATAIVSAFTLFMVGRELQIGRLRAEGRTPLTTALGEGSATFLAVSIASYLVTGSPIVSLALGATATPTAPATVMIVLHQYTPRGPLTRLLRSTVALDDVLATAAGAVVISIAGWFTVGEFGAGEFGAAYLLVVPVVGAGGGALLAYLLPHFRDYGHRSALVIGIVLAFLGLQALSPIAPQVAALVAGFVLVNQLRYSRAFWHKFEEFLDFVYLVFFVYLGAHLQPDLILGAPLLLGAYILARGLGKGIGATVGCACTGLNIRTGAYLGIALMPQGTLSLVLAAMAEKIYPASDGLILNIVLASTLFFEAIGPFGTALAIRHYRETHDINRRSGAPPATR